MARTLTFCALHRRTGISLIGTLISLSILSSGFLLFSRSMSVIQKQRRNQADKVMAGMYASELLEFFQSFQTAAELEKYLKRNPINGRTRSVDLYSFCSEINILNRQTGRKVNADPIADLPATRLDGANAKIVANRFYRIDIVNLSTLQIDSSACSKNPATAGARGANETYLITVGVSWVPPGRPVSEATEVTLASVLHP